MGQARQTRPPCSCSVIMGGRRFKLLPTDRPTELTPSLFQLLGRFRRGGEFGQNEAGGLLARSLARLPEECNLLQHLRGRGVRERGRRNLGRHFSGREKRGSKGRASGSCLSLDVGRGPQGLNLIKERRASDAVSGRRVGNGWRRKDGEFSIESRAKSGTPL